MPNESSTANPGLYVRLAMSLDLGPGYTGQPVNYDFDVENNQFLVQSRYVGSHNLPGAEINGPNGPALPPCINSTFRFTTDRNKGLLEKLKDMPRIYRKKIFRVRDVCKSERYYDIFKGRWRWRPVYMEITRLVPVKRTLSQILRKHNQRVSNDLHYDEVQYKLAGNVTNATFRQEDTWSATPNLLVRTVIVNGDILAADTRSAYANQSFSNANMSLIKDFGPNRTGLSGYNPVGWPGSYGTLESTLFAEHHDLINLLDDSTLTKLYSKVKNAKLDLATDLAEISQTVGLISDMAVALGKTFLALKRGNLLEAIKHLVPTNRGQVSNVFLAYRYGVAPLISDIQGAAEMLAERILNLPCQFVRSKKRKRIVTTEVFGGITITKTTTIDVKYQIFYLIDGTETLSNLSRLGFTSPVNVAWELIPFSFVFDWFLPIGNWLSSLSALEGYKVKEITRTVAVRQTVFCDFLLPVHSPENAEFWPIEPVIFSWSMERFQMLRETIPSLPSLPLPRWRNPLTIGRALNALAILSQMFRGK